MNFHDRYLENTQISDFMKIHVVEAKLFCADWWTRDKANSHFLLFVNTPKKVKEL